MTLNLIVSEEQVTSELLSDVYQLFCDANCIYNSELSKDYMKNRAINDLNNNKVIIWPYNNTQFQVHKYPHDGDRVRLEFWGYANDKSRISKINMFSVLLDEYYNKNFKDKT